MYTVVRPCLFLYVFSYCTNSAALIHSQFLVIQMFLASDSSIFIWPPAELCYLFKYCRARKIHLFAALEWHKRQLSVQQSCFLTPYSKELNVLAESWKNESHGDEAKSNLWKHIKDELMNVYIIPMWVLTVNSWSTESFIKGFFFFF